MTQSEEFWNERYRKGETPWDYGGVSPEFTDYLKRQSQPGRLLVPGCGTGHEVRAARDAGFDVLGIELSTEAAERARERLGAGPGKVVAADFFSYPFPDDKFDAIFERTFLCAIPPELRPDYAQRMYSLLKPGGILFGLFLYGDEPDPPPYPLKEGEEKTLLEPFFELVESRPSQAPLPFFAGMERWQVWRRRPKAD